MTNRPLSSKNESRAVVLLFAATLALLPWSWFPPFPWLHEHAQWSDIVFAATAVVWLGDRWRTRQWPQFHPVHVAMVLYLSAATFSLLFAAPVDSTRAMKLVGICELVVIGVITGDLAARAQTSRLIGKVIAATSVIACIAALAGLGLFYLGFATDLVGPYGDLYQSSWYARVKGGTTHPNMLASFCIFASAVLARADNEFSPKVRRLLQATLFVTVLFTFSRGILAFFVATIIRMSRGTKQRAAALAAVIICIVMIAILTIWNLSINPARPLATRFNDELNSSRRDAAVSSWRTLVEKPIFGSGTGERPGTRLGRPSDAHMTLLNIAATMGLPALLAFLGLFAALWRAREQPMSRSTLAVWSGLAGLMLDGLAQDVEDFRHLWVLFGLAAVAQKTAQNGNRDEAMPPKPLSAQSS